MSEEENGRYQSGKERKKRKEKKEKSKERKKRIKMTLKKS
jgi:hypothetical protein